MRVNSAPQKKSRQRGYKEEWLGQQNLFNKRTGRNYGAVALHISAKHNQDNKAANMENSQARNSFLSSAKCGHLEDMCDGSQHTS